MFLRFLLMLLQYIFFRLRVSSDVDDDVDVTFAAGADGYNAAPPPPPPPCSSSSSSSSSLLVTFRW
jgi:hypothetical protein